jgi:hypothetical protein
MRTLYKVKLDAIVLSFLTYNTRLFKKLPEVSP